MFIYYHFVILRSIKQLQNEENEFFLNDLVSLSTENEQKIHEMISTFEEMKGISGIIEQIMNQLTQVNHDNSTAVEEISSSIYEISHQIDKLNNLAQLLAGMAMAQEVQLSQFILN